VGEWRSRGHFLLHYPSTPILPLISEPVRFVDDVEQRLAGVEASAVLQEQLGTTLLQIRPDTCNMRGQ
jgi:hypothetical protein